MYTAVRVVIEAVFFAALALISKPLGKQSKKRYIFCFAISAILTFGLGFFSFENSFISFDSAEDAYRYTNFCKYKDLVCIDGNSSSLIIEHVKGENEYGLATVPKTADGWKLNAGFGINPKIHAMGSSQRFSATIYRHKGTEDYYVVVTSFDGAPNMIEDSQHSHFIPLGEGYGEIYAFAAFINDYSGDYILTVDGEMLSFVEAPPVISFKKQNG